MASSSEAFEKFWQWNKAKTWLNVTVVEKEKAVDHLLARIGGVDEEASLVRLVGKQMHSWTNLDVDEAEFSVEERRVVAARNADEWVIFEESES